MTLSDWLGMPPDWSQNGWQIDNLILWLHVLMAVLFVGWGIFFVYTLVRFRSGRNPRADYTGARSHASSYLETAVVIAEVILLVGLSIPLWAERVHDFPDAKDAVEVHVSAEQFTWFFHYAGPDGKFGKLDRKLVQRGINPLGRVLDDPAGKDDVVIEKELHVPVNRPVILRMTSKDVIHSFFIPVMRVKQDVIPGIEASLYFTPVKEGRAYIACAQLCGVEHYNMRGYLTVEGEAEYDSWLKQQNPQSGMKRRQE